MSFRCQHACDDTWKYGVWSYVSSVIHWMNIHDIRYMNSKTSIRTRFCANYVTNVQQYKNMFLHSFIPFSHSLKWEKEYCACRERVCMKIRFSCMHSVQLLLNNLTTGFKYIVNLDTRRLNCLEIIIQTNIIYIYLLWLRQCLCGQRKWLPALKLGQLISCTMQKCLYILVMLSKTCKLSTNLEKSHPGISKTKNQTRSLLENVPVIPAVFSNTRWQPISQL